MNDNKGKGAKQALVKSDKEQSNWEEISPEQMEKEIAQAKASKKQPPEKEAAAKKTPKKANRETAKATGRHRKTAGKSSRKKTISKKSASKQKIKKATNSKRKAFKPAPQKHEIKHGTTEYRPIPDSGGSSPVEHNLGNGMKMMIDRQSSFKPEYCQKLVAHMAQGDSFETFGVKIGIGRTTLYRWCQKFPIFKEAYDLAWISALKFYEDLLKADTLGMEPVMTGADGKKLNLSKLKSENIKYVLNRRFKELYAERQELDARTTNYDGNIDVSQLTGEELDKREKQLESQLAGTRNLIRKIIGPNPLEEGDS